MFPNYKYYFKYLEPKRWWWPHWNNRFQKRTKFIFQTCVRKITHHTNCLCIMHVACVSVLWHDVIDILKIIDPTLILAPMLVLIWCGCSTNRLIFPSLTLLQKICVFGILHFCQEEKMQILLMRLCSTKIFQIERI